MQEDQQTNATRFRMWGTVVFAAIIGGFGALALLQRIGVDVGQRLFNPCGFYIRTGYTCPTCGMTRAVLAFSRGDWLYAWRMQPAAAFLCTILMAIALIGLWTAILGRCPNFVHRFFQEIRVKHLLWMLGLILLAGWGVTLARSWAALH